MDLVVRGERLPRPGETVLGGSLHTVPGGKGANQAVACARLGAATTLVGRVGEDDFGRTLLSGLRAEGVAVDTVAIESGASSGLAVILLDPDAGNRIIVISGANATLGEEEIVRAEGLLEQCDAVLMQLEIPLSVVTRVAAAAARARSARDTGRRRSHAGRGERGVVLLSGRDLSE